ncbi:MAG TPA: hypothetical protein VN710_07395 [Verrucomicrobiae bacterium]|jgi:hypothetical protein|nr:hypothetical protein [Verrucomicrobiae bacterium]
MQSKLVLAAVGCLSFAVMAHAQTSDTPTDAMQPPAAPYGATDAPGGALPPNTPLSPIPPPVATPGNVGSPTSNLSELTVIQDGTVVRESPDESSRLLSTLYAGNKVLALGAADGWTHVIIGLADGYVRSQLLK